MAIAFPFASMARSIALPLTIRALEFGKSFTTLGGRPIFSALLKSVLYPGRLAVMALPPQAVLGEDQRDTGIIAVDNRPFKLNNAVEEEGNDRCDPTFFPSS
jgi:hypothetical protein